VLLRHLPERSIVVAHFLRHRSLRTFQAYSGAVVGGLGIETPRCITGSLVSVSIMTMSYGEEDACMSYEEEDTYLGNRGIRIPGGTCPPRTAHIPPVLVLHLYYIMCVCECVYHTHSPINTYIHTYIRIYLHTYIRYTHTHTHTHTHTDLSIGLRSDAAAADFGVGVRLPARALLAINAAV
jgi:hypothetical protein